MTPDPHPTPAEQVAELEVAAKIAHENGNRVFAQELAQHAHYLRMQAKQDEKNEANRQRP